MPARTKTGLWLMVLAAFIVQVASVAAQSKVSRARALEIDVALTFLADPELCRYYPGARVESNCVRIAGYVPNANLQLRAMQIAKSRSAIKVVNNTQVHPALLIKPVFVKGETLLQQAAEALKTEFTGVCWSLQLALHGRGRLVLQGGVEDLESKLRVSERLRRIGGCQCIVNHLTVGAPRTTVAPSLVVIPTTPQPAVNQVQVSTIANHQPTAPAPKVPAIQQVEYQPKKTTPPLALPTPKPQPRLPQPKPLAPKTLQPKLPTPQPAAPVAPQNADVQLPQIPAAPTLPTPQPQPRTHPQLPIPNGTAPVKITPPLPKTPTYRAPAKKVTFEATSKNRVESAPKMIGRTIWQRAKALPAVQRQPQVNVQQWQAASPQQQSKRSVIIIQPKKQSMNGFRPVSYQPRPRPAYAVVVRPQQPVRTVDLSYQRPAKTAGAANPIADSSLTYVASIIQQSCPGIRDLRFDMSQAGAIVLHFSAPNTDTADAYARTIFEMPSLSHRALKLHIRAPIR